MEKIVYTEHFREMLDERDIKVCWVEDTLKNPDVTENCSDGNTHYVKRIVENNSRHLRVILNVNSIPYRAVTVFFDRRLRKNKK